MRKGDNVLCKQTYGDAYYKGNFYEVTSVTDNGEIFVDSREYNPWIFLPRKYKLDSAHKNNAKFHDFFLTGRQIRKMKVNKLNKIFIPERLSNINGTIHFMKDKMNN